MKKISRNYGFIVASAVVTLAFAALTALLCCGANKRQKEVISF